MGEQFGELLMAITTNVSELKGLSMLRSAGIKIICCRTFFYLILHRGRLAQAIRRYRWCLDLCRREDGGDEEARKTRESLFRKSSG